MKRFYFVSVFLTVCVAMAYAWGQKGHDAIAKIAERHLTPTAKSAIDSILDGRSIIYWANWLDNASHTPEYAYTKTWHYKNFDEGVRYEEAPANPSGDVVTAMRAQIEKLSDPSVNKEDAALALKILVHITGDLHQPMHMGHATDLGANRVGVKFFGRDTNLHSVWDSSILEGGHKWSYSEWAEILDILPEEDVSAVADGSFDDWAKETLNIATVIYREMPAGSKISYNEVADWTPTVEQQLLRGGLRLARILNSLFDPSMKQNAPYVPVQ